MRIKKIIYAFVLRMILYDRANGKLFITGKQKAQIESLIIKFENM